MILFGLLTSLGFAQTKRNSQNQPTVQKKCDGAWSGTVNYRRVLKTEYSEGTSEFAKRNFVGAENSKQSSREVIYDGKIILDGKPDPNIPAFAMNVGGQFMGASSQKGRVNASILETESEQAKSSYKDNCGANDTRDKTCEGTMNANAEASVRGESDFSLNFQGGTYGFSFRFPEANSTRTVTKKSSCKNFCQDKNNGSGNTTENFPVRYEIERVSVKGQKYDPKSAERLQGSHTETRLDGRETVTISWNLRKCAAPLQLIDLKFEHPQFPNPEDWTTVSDSTGTIDGNRVKIKATVFNSTATEQSVTVNFKELKENIPLPDGKVTAQVAAGEAKEVEFLWDTSGFAWNDAGNPEPNREIKAEITDDSITEKIKILPKPVVLVHGLWSNAAAWAEYPSYLREAHSFAWKAYAVGAEPQIAKMNTGDHPGNSGPTNTIFQNAQELGKQIKHARTENNAWHVDIVAHSMGGLISRQYINAFMAPVFDNKPEIAHLEMLGTPNMGSPCADLVGNIFEFFGQNDMNAMRELRPSVVAEFNKRTTNRKNVKFSILIGYAIPQTCQSKIIGDGVVPVPSAKFNITDRDYAFRDHVSLTDDVNFKAFVLPRLAVGPKKAQAEKQTAWLENFEPGNFALAKDLQDRYGFNKYFQKVSYKRTAERQSAQEEDAVNFTARQKITLSPKQSKEIEIPAGSSGKTGVVIVASTAVAATLSDANGAVLSKSEGGMEAVKNLFRTIYADKNPAGGALKLKLENFDARETTVFVGRFTNGDADSEFTVEAGKPNAAGIVPLIAKWTKSNAPVLNAKIVANIAGQSDGTEFFDDGKHSDGAANDGVYGASVKKSKSPDFLVEATAEIGGRTFSAGAIVKISGANAGKK